MNLFMKLIGADHGVAFVWLALFCNKDATKRFWVRAHDCVADVAWDDGYFTISDDLKDGLCIILGGYLMLGVVPATVGG